MTVNELAKNIKCRALSLPDGEREVCGVYIGDLLSWVMGRASEGDAWITIMSNINTVAVATLADVSCIILAEGVSLDDEVLAVAKEKGVNVLTTEMSAYNTAVALHGII
ncbi:MAG: hypothetical protein IJ515_00250 [Clostridia bacterium]|nr:hypothetical protein [Clostridia bacterium]